MNVETKSWAEFIHSHVHAGSDVDFQNMQGCFKSNDTANFSCSLTDNFPISGTVWNGTAFNCPHSNSIINNRIYLAHSDFSEVAFGICNNGQIFAQSVGISGFQYTSMLSIILVTLDMNGSTIICSLLGGSMATTKILRVGGRAKQ